MSRFAKCARASVAFLALAGSPVVAQEVRLPEAAPLDTADSLPPSPGTAFVRSLLVPGWGQASSGAYFRGGVYFAAQTGSWFMLLKTMARIGEARSVERRRALDVRTSLLAAAAEDTVMQKRYSFPDSLAADVSADPGVSAARGLVRARTRQREDWIAWTIFWTLASGVDALVAAHFADFPAEVAAEPSESGGVRLKFSVPAGRRP